MTRLVMDMGIEKFDHLVDAVALVRPGPANSGMTDEYIRRKHGGKWQRKNNIYEEITKNTYGVIIFQEQIMQVINKVAGLPYNIADEIRKIISKKRDKQKFEKYYKMFLDGCKKEKLFSKSDAIEFWEGLQEHAHYSFNRAHSCCYSIVGIWTAYLKHYYPTEFICASLTYGADNKKSDLIEESYRLGLTLKLPKVGISHPTDWVAKDNCLFVPFTEIKGIGPKKASEASISAQSNIKNGITSFVKKSIVEPVRIQKHKGKLGGLLDSIGAYDSNDIKITEDIEKLFDFRIVLNPKSHYANLYKLFDNEIELSDLDNVIGADTKTLKKLLPKHKRIVRPKIFQGFDDLSTCDKCLLRSECLRPVHPSPGKFNIMIVGEAPGKNEDEKGKGFIGTSGNLIWKFLSPKGYERELFHVSNINKCFPSQTRTPTKEQINICTENWLKYEIKKVKPRIILAFGNTNRYFFEGVRSGITSISGKTTWNEKYNTWIAWCVHPSSVLHNPDNKIHFNNGMKNFVRLLKIFGKDILK
jgi:uracil-DNA glycosylase family 4